MDNLNTLARELVTLLQRRNLKIAFAESCTGGLAAAAITSVPGSSEVLDMSIVTYANAAKVEYTAVTEEILAEHGAVSEQTARLMAAGIRERSGADIGAGITGIAGPGGGTAAKPVGTVWIAADYRGKCRLQLFTFGGNRDEVRAQSVNAVLKMCIDLIKSM